MELNEASLIERELTLRNMRLTSEVLETRRSLLRWLALTLGIINPGESRLSAVAVLDALITFQFIKKTDPNVSEIMQYIGENWQQINEKTLRYHLLRLKNMGIIENKEGKFYFAMPGVGDRYDAGKWASSLFEADRKEIASKVGEAINEIRNKSYK